MKYRRTLLALALGMTTFATLAAGPDGASQDAARDQAIAATVKDINPNAKISGISKTPISGLNEVLVDGVVLYISDDGKYLVHGTMLDVKQRKNLTELAGADARRGLLKSIPEANKIVFKPQGKVKHRVTVFTDISCGYCHKLHEQIDGFLAKGIQVDYVAFPRGGSQSPVMEQMKAVWCAKDRKAAYAAAMEGEEAEPVAGCKSGVPEMYAIGDKMGIQGTPAVYSDDGMLLGGYLSPTKLAGLLDKNRAPGQPDAEEVEALDAAENAIQAPAKPGKLAKASR